MTDVSPRSLLARWKRARKTPRAPDPADMGTAFGMECSLGASAPAPPAPVPEPPRTAPGWLDRRRAAKGGG
jgi:hypothetical protein